MYLNGQITQKFCNIICQSLIIIIMQELVFHWHSTVSDCNSLMHQCRKYGQLNITYDQRLLI